MVLYREDLVLGALDTLDCGIEQIYVRGTQTRGGQRVGIYGEVMVLARDLDMPRVEVLDGVVAAAVSELHLEGAGAVCQRYELVSETYSEQGHLAAYRTYEIDHFGNILRVARAVREEYAVGIEGHDALTRGVVGHHGDVATLGVELADDVVFDAAVDGYDVVFVVWRT